MILINFYLTLVTKTMGWWFMSPRLVLIPGIGLHMSTSGIDGTVGQRTVSTVISLFMPRDGSWGSNSGSAASCLHSLNQLLKALFFFFKRQVLTL